MKSKFGTFFCFFGSCFCFMDLPCTSCSRVHFSGDVYVVALLCHMEVSIVMGLSPWLWMVYFMENPSINGWWLGVPPMTMENPHMFFQTVFCKNAASLRESIRGSASGNQNFSCIWKSTADENQQIWDTASNNLYDCFICFSMSTSLEGEQFLPPFPRQALRRS